MQSRQSTGTKTTATSAPPPIARPADSALHVARQSSSSIVAVSSTTSHAHVGGGDGERAGRLPCSDCCIQGDGGGGGGGGRVNVARCAGVRGFLGEVWFCGDV